MEHVIISGPSREDTRIKAIKAVRNFLDTSLKDAKDFIENLPKKIKLHDLKIKPEYQYEDFKNDMERYGYKVEEPEDNLKSLIMDAVTFASDNRKYHIAQDLLDVLIKHNL